MYEQRAPKSKFDTLSTHYSSKWKINIFLQNIEYVLRIGKKEGKKRFSGCMQMCITSECHKSYAAHKSSDGRRNRARICNANDVKGAPRP